MCREIFTVELPAAADPKEIEAFEAQWKKAFQKENQFKEPPMLLFLPHGFKLGCVQNEVGATHIHNYEKTRLAVPVRDSRQRSRAE